MRIYIALALGLHCVSARSLPHLAVDEGILSLSMEPSEPIWNCSVRTWVRAPDLAPNMHTRADVRVITEGSECKDITGMDVGLRMSERAVYKFRAPGVELPEQPEMDYSDYGSYSHNDSIFKVDSFGPSSWGQSPAQQAFEVKQVEYAKFMENPTIWHAAGVERKVFDQKVSLEAPEVDASGSQKEDIQSFEVHMPNTNLPSSLKDTGRGMYGEVEMVTSESLFEYYVALTLQNGSIVDYPSGRSGFLPVASSKSLSKEMRTEQVSFRNPRLDYVEEDPSGKGSSSFKITKRRMRRGLWDNQKSPSCDDGNLAEFHVEIQLPDNATFVPGQSVLLNTSITRSGNGSEVATHVSLVAQGCRSEHWAAEHAHSDDLKNLTVQCQDRQWYGDFGDSSENLALLPFNKTRFVDRLEEEVKSCSDEGRRHFFSSSSSSFSDWGAGRSVSKLNPALEKQNVQVNFTVPAGGVPNFEGSLRDFISRMEVILRTEFTCEKGHKAGEHGGEPDSNDDNPDALWESLYHSRLIDCPQEGIKRTSYRQSATLPIKIRPAELGDAQDYRESGAKAPTLVPVGYTGKIKFDTVGTEQTAETDPAQLQQSRYTVYQRMPPRNCAISSRQCGRSGGEHGHVAEAWMHYEMRDELKAIKREVEEKYREGRHD